VIEANDRQARVMRPIVRTGLERNYLCCRLSAPSGDCSIELAVDFVRRGTTSDERGRHFETYLDWRNRVLHLFAHHQPGRTSTLSWNHVS
jgi:hypothetical protein